MAKLPNIPNFNQPLVNGNLTDRVWYNFFNLISTKLSKPSSWTTVNRPTNIEAGFSGYNTTTNKAEMFNGTNWFDLN